MSWRGVTPLLTLAPSTKCCRTNSGQPRIKLNLARTWGHVLFWYTIQVRIMRTLPIRDLCISTALLCKTRLLRPFRLGRPVSCLRFPVAD